MSQEINVNTIAAETTANLIKSSFNSILSGASEAMKRAWTKIFEDFSPYAERIFNKNSYVKIICVKERDVALYDIYVNSTFTCDRDVFSDEELICNIREGQNVVINGNGGAGKTFFMRHLWLTIFKNPQGVVPIFVELRSLNEFSAYDLKTLIRHTIARNGIAEDVFDYFCRLGKFCFILDGFDEVIEEARAPLQHQILDLASRFNDCCFVVSSRPDNRFSGWQSFQTYQSAPFTYDQVKELLQRVPFDPEFKQRFLKKLDKKFYEANASFLSNPLLSIMMMMTFKENMNIPRSMNIFYDQAFSTLYQWHDATKAYSRQKTLDIEEFRKSFGVFCLLSYYNEQYEFSLTEIREYISMSNKVLNYSFEPDDVIRDYVQSVNLMQQEGFNYTFVHRSFQEYFAAYALTKVLHDKFEKFIKNLKGRSQDNFLQMAYEIDNELVTKKYLSPEYEAYLANLPRRHLSKDPFRLLRDLNISYEFYIPSPKERRSDIHFRISFPSECLSLVAIILKFKRSYSQDAFGLLFLNIFAHELFDSITSGLRQAPSGSQIRRGTVSFGINDLTVSIDEWDGAESDVQTAKEVIEAQIQKRKSDALSFATEFRSNLEEARSWCEDRIADSKSRGQSIDDILDS